MTIQQIYQLAIKMGTEADLRGKVVVGRLLARLRNKYSELSKEQKEEFDQERLTNPFSDTRILLDNKKPIKKILTGIDMEVGEMLLADKLGDIDLVLAHHPSGVGLAGLDDVMHLQIDLLSVYGVPINIAESLIKLRIEEVSRRIAPANHNEAVDAARLLKLNFMCVHTPADNLVAAFLDRLIKKAKPEYVEDLLKLLKNIPEYKQAMKMGAGPRLFSGRPENHGGKIALTEITGGTEGSPQIFEKLAQAGIGTVVAMHMSEEHRKEAEKAHLYNKN
ncbi:MAG: NGG1p interacting factor NIF3 [Candidatus Parcubacteria bacterium]|nr:NGG1p interacting factor NIF3 [Candidatus Parcubacteria bacterium]